MIAKDIPEVTSKSDESVFPKNADNSNITVPK